MSRPNWFTICFVAISSVSLIAQGARPDRLGVGHRSGTIYISHCSYAKSQPTFPVQ
jgi:hypothetical protein